MAWMEWPGSGSTYSAVSVKRTSLEEGSAVDRGLDSWPVTPSISGLSDFIQPSMWSKDRFSWTSTTTVLMRLVAVVASAAAAVGMLSVGYICNVFVVASWSSCLYLYLYL
ncbi:non-specific phospholipase C4-like [Iris pallida]|uniref:Non-specific phospholipase C4-like n=1 Tax=Iris pallida TaxID=29817 RepID=A0AAX6IF48_IRIPA|nr:non-specific phospholipase C4-like [Iris pallida]